MVPGPRIATLLAALSATILVTGCGGGGGPSKGGSCSSAEELASPERGEDTTAASRAVLGMAASFKGSANLAADIAPAVSPGYQSQETGKKATWEVAVLQLADTPRSLEVDFGEGETARLEVPAGSGACLFEVSRSFDEPANRREVKFTVGGQAAGKPVSFAASVDVVAKR